MAFVKPYDLFQKRSGEKKSRVNCDRLKHEFPFELYLIGTFQVLNFAETMIGLEGDVFN